MRKLALIIIIVSVLMMGCDNPASGDSDTNNDNGNTSITYGYSYVIDGGDVNLIKSTSTSRSTRSIDISEKITDVTSIAVLNRNVVKTDAGNYYLENVGKTDFDLITLPESGTLHMHQFSYHDSYIYFGVGNTLYKVSTSDADFTDAVDTGVDTFFDTGNLNVKLQYMVMNDDSIDYNAEGTVGNGPHIAYVSYDVSGDVIWLANNANLCDDEAIGTFGFTTPKYFGQEHATNDVVVYGRIDENNSYAWDGEYTFHRDTMFRSYWDNQVYFENDSERVYIVLDSDGADVSVKSYITSDRTANQMNAVQTFTVDFETIGSYTKLVPNMWVDTNGDVYVVKGDTVYLNGETTVVATHTSRIDEISIADDIIYVMDESGDWFEVDEVDDDTTYHGTSVIIAQY